MALWLLFSKYNLKFNPKLETLITSLNIVVILHCSMLHMIRTSIVLKIGASIICIYIKSPPEKL